MVINSNSTVTVHKCSRQLRLPVHILKTRAHVNNAQGLPARPTACGSRVPVNQHYGCVRQCVSAHKHGLGEHKPRPTLLVFEESH